MKHLTPVRCSPAPQRPHPCNTLTPKTPCELRLHLWSHTAKEAQPLRQASKPWSTQTNTQRPAAASGCSLRPKKPVNVNRLRKQSASPVCQAEGIWTTERPHDLPPRLEAQPVDTERQQLLTLRHWELARELGRRSRAYAGAKALHAHPAVKCPALLHAERRSSACWPAEQFCWCQSPSDAPKCFWCNVLFCSIFKCIAKWSGHLLHTLSTAW